MKRVSIFLIILFCTTFSFGQDVKPVKIEVTKNFPADNQQTFYFELAFLTDISNFTYLLDQGRTVINEMKDDTGFDLLAAQKEFEAEYEKKGFGYDKLRLEYRKPVDVNNVTGIVVGGRAAVVPKQGAKTVKIAGTVGMIDLADGKKTYELKSIPTEMPWGSPGVKTKAGMIKLQESGSLSLNGVEFTKYQVRSSGSPVSSVKVAGGDDREEAKGFGLERNEVIFKKIPEKIDLVVEVNQTEIKEIPFEVEMSLGL